MIRARYVQDYSTLCILLALNKSHSAWIELIGGGKWPHFLADSTYLPVNAVLLDFSHNSFLVQ
jgi:hypothetical protein